MAANRTKPRGRPVVETASLFGHGDQGGGPLAPPFACSGESRNFSMQPATNVRHAGNT